jgi:hypothetical protein
LLAEGLAERIRNVIARTVERNTDIVEEGAQVVAEIYLSAGAGPAKEL